MDNQTRTEDEQLISQGSTVFDYYASELDATAIGTVQRIDSQGWFDVLHADGRTSYRNGSRVCSLKTAIARGWISEADRSNYPNHSNPKGHTMSNHTTTEDHAPAHGMPRPRLATQPTTLEIVRNIENGNRAQAAEQITEHPEPARMAIAVLTTLADHTGFNSTAEDWRDAVATVVRTLNAAR